jgi:hypothetical protein
MKLDIHSISMRKEQVIPSREPSMCIHPMGKTRKFPWVTTIGIVAKGNGFLKTSFLSECGGEGIGDRITYITPTKWVSSIQKVFMTQEKKRPNSFNSTDDPMKI